MLRKKYLTESIGIKLAQLKVSIANLNAIHFFDQNTAAEDFFTELLNAVYGYSLVNLNHNDLNNAAIDLGDSAGRLAVQVTSQRAKVKIQKTLDTFSKHGLSSNYDSLKVVIIGDRTGDYKNLNVPAGLSFVGSRDVIDIVQLMKDIAKLNTETLESIVALIGREFTDEAAALPGKFCIETHNNTVEKVCISDCIRFGKPLIPPWLNTDPERMCSDWLVDRLASNAELGLFLDPKWEKEYTLSPI